MNTSFHHSESRGLKKKFSTFFIAPLLAMVFLSCGATTAFAAVTVTEATGGTNISADKAANAISPAYTALGNIVIQSQASNDFPKNQKRVTLILSAPSGWGFNPGIGTLIAGGTEITADSIAVTASTITATYTRSKKDSSTASLTISGIQVRATSGAVIPASGSIFQTGGTGAAIVGITLNSTNFGSLSQVVGAASKLAFTTQPGSATYGSALSTQPIVVTRDQFSNPSTSGLGTSKTVTLTLTSGTGLLQGVTTLDIGTGAGNGTVTFNSLKVSAAGTGKGITAAATGLTNAISNSFAISALPVVLSGTRTYDTTAVAAYGILSVSNKVGSDDVIVASGSSTLASADVGAESISSFGTLALGGTTAGNYTLIGGSGTVTITKADQTITFNALPDKAFGDPDFLVSATSSSSLTVTFTSMTTGVCTVSTATVHLVSAGTCTIRASQTGNGNYNAAIPVDQSFTVTAGPAASFTLNNPGSMYAKSRLGYTVTRFDALGNATGMGTTTVYLYTTSTSTTEKFYNDSLAGSVIASIDILPGHSTANFWYYDETPGTYTITASDNATAPDGAAGIADATQLVTVNPVATQFVILPPTNGTVDAPITVTVQARKPDNSVDTNYQNDVTLNVSGSATGGGLVDIINGVGTKNISDTVAETVSLSLADSQNTGLTASSTQQVVFATGAIAQFTLTHPAASAAGQRAAYVVTRKDQFGNVNTSATTTVYLYSSSTGTNKKFYDASTTGNIISSVTIGDGQSSANFWYYDELPGTWSITASDNASAPDGNIGINDAVDSHQVIPGPVAIFTLNHPGVMTVGTRLGYTVTRTDQFNTPVTSGVTPVYLYSNSTGSSSPTFYDAATAGNTITSISIPDGQSSISFWYSDQNPGTWTVTASDNATAPDGTTGITDGTDSVTVSAAPIVATRFVILQPTNGTVDAPITVTVQAQDGSGNIDTTYQKGVTLVTNGSATGGGLVTIVDGVGTLPISDTVAQSVNLSLLDSQATGLDVSSSRQVVFAPGAVAQFALDNPGDVAAGTRIGYTVTRKDKFGNAVTRGATTVYLYSSSTGVNKKFYDAASGGSTITSIIIPEGASSIGFWYYDEKAGNWTITASDNPVAPDGTAGIADASDAITVQPAAVAKFLLNDPGNMTAGTRLGYIVTREDQFDNLVTTGVTLAYLYSSSTGTTTAFYTTATGGAATTFATINDGSSSGDFWYYDQTPGTWLVTASDSSGGANGAVGILDAVDSVTVSAIPIVASRFVILPVGAVQAGTPATVTIEAQDNAGNIDTTFQTGVTLLVSGSATGGGLVNILNGIGTKSLSDTVSETVALSLSDTQHTGLDVSSTQSLLFSPVPVAAGAGVSFTPVVPRITGVRISGSAFPGAQIQILAVSPSGTNVQGQTTADANGSFSTLLTDIQTGAGAYGLVGVDALGRATQTKVLNANFADKDSLLTLDAALLSPTLGLVHPMVRKNDVVGFVGMAVPGYTVSAQVDGVTSSSTVVAASDGSYKMLFGTGALANGSHTVRVRQISPSGLRSEYTPQKIFTVTSLFTPQTDFNQDGVINVQDWSIFLSRWNSTNPAIRLLDDLNGDGKVDVTDLSIFVRTLKK